MSDPVIVSIIAGCFGCFQAYVGFRQHEMSKQITEIHILTNSNLTKVKNDLSDANAKLEALKGLMIADTSGKHLEGPPKEVV